MKITFKEIVSPVIDVKRIQTLNQKWPMVGEKPLNNISKYRDKPISSIVRLGAPYGHSFEITYDNYPFGDIHLTYSVSKDNVPVYRLDVLPNLAFDETAGSTNDFCNIFEDILEQFLLYCSIEGPKWDLEGFRPFEIILPINSRLEKPFQAMYEKFNFYSIQDGRMRF